MKRTYAIAEVKCPFFKWVEGKTICCEGCYAGCKGIILDHDTKKDMEKQKFIFCSDNFEYCEVYRMICEAKY